MGAKWLMALAAYLIGGAGPHVAFADPPILTALLTSTGAPMTKERANVIFTLTNNTERPLRVLKWQTPLEELAGRTFVVRCNGSEVEYRGPLIKRAAPAEEDYLTIAGHSSVRAEVDLAMYYDLPADADCEVTFDGALQDVQPVDAVRSAGERQPLRLEKVSSTTFKLK